MSGVTISRDRRIADQATAFRIMAAELRDDEIVQRKWWNLDRPDLAVLIPTTWHELVERGLAVQHNRSNLPIAYELTEAGWVEGLRLAGVLDSDAFRGRCVELVRYCKSKNAGRRDSHDARVGWQEIGRSFPLPWVINVLRSR